MIKLVREPSDTPNIQNTDDFIGLRYSYGDYNGYVDKKGQMFDYQINGSTFTVLSGRAVINGVEVDVDANGASITIDNVSQIQYHKLYIRVNLVTMKADLYDVIGLSDDPVSDDLTLNASGIAYLLLYSFTSSAGVISSVLKKVEKITTLKSVVSGDIPVVKATNANNANKINELEIKKDENGILKIGDIIIPQKKLVWINSSGLSTSTNGYVDIEIENGIGNVFTPLTYVVKYTYDGRDYTKIFDLNGGTGETFYIEHKILVRKSNITYSVLLMMIPVTVQSNTILRFGKLTGLTIQSSGKNIDNNARISPFEDTYSEGNIRLYSVYQIVS